MVKVKRERLEENKVDRISMLSNEVLGFILSFLTLKEATATSRLSRRWEYMWTLTRKLDLDGTSSLRKFKESRDKDYLHEERVKYVRCVDHLISSLRHHKSSHNLEEFKLLFDLTQSHKQWIDDWLSYAVSRKVESLELNLIDVECIYNRDCLCYNFPYKNGNFPNNLRVLRKLSTHLVNVTGEAVEIFLRNCPMLEQVSVSRSQGLTSLEITRTFPSFICLEISYCQNLESFVVRDSNVVCIKYNGNRIRRRFELIDVPILTQLWIMTHSRNHIEAVVKMFASVLPQLEMFKLYVMSKLSWQESTKIVSGVEMRKLKEMVVSIGKYYEDWNSLLPVINLISMSPRLQRFVLEEHWIYKRYERIQEIGHDILQELKKSLFWLSSSIFSARMKEH